MRVQVDMMESLRNLKKMEHLSVWNVGSLSAPADTAAWEEAGFLLTHTAPPPIVSCKIGKVLSVPIILHQPVASSQPLPPVPVCIDEQDLRILGALPELHFLELNVSTTEVVCNNPTIDAAGDGHLFQKLRHCSLGYKELRCCQAPRTLGL